MILGNLIKSARDVDKRWHRTIWPSRRRVLVNARTAMNYSTIAPIVDRMCMDSRLEFYFTASENHAQVEQIYSEAGKSSRLVSPPLAAIMRFDAYLAADFLWVKLPRGAQRVQIFHGVAGKYRTIYDSPSRSMREWHRLFFINRHRLQHFIQSGAIDADSSAARLIGMPKVDCLVDGSLERDYILTSLGVDPSRRTVMYAPTWSPYSSLGVMGEELVRRLSAAGYAVIVKLHDRSRDPQFIHSGGVDWRARLEPLLLQSGGLVATRSNSSQYLPAADALITDHSSIGFEYLLLDRPLIRIDLPELIEKTDIEPAYVGMLSSASTNAVNVEEVVTAVEQSFEAPQQGSANRRAVAGEMFYKPGSATTRAVQEMYKVLELDPL